ncbi:thioesterase II [Lactarius vividus]|nr:thioesterase II [Lactarius vividus]
MADSDPVDHDQVEPSDISVALDVEQLDLNLYRSRNLFTPYEARGVFGGQVISQALVAATKCVKPEFLLHVSPPSLPQRFHPNHPRCLASLYMYVPLPTEAPKLTDAAGRKAYFILSASASVPLLYYVDRLREGRSYSTRSVRAMQGGRVVFVMLCSFQIPEIWQPSRQWSMPQVPRPEDCENEVEYIRRIASQPSTPEEFRARLLGHAKSREESPISVKPAGIIANEPEGRSTHAYWMKAKMARQHPAAFQKCILAYITDLHLLSSAVHTAGMRRHAPPGPKALAMASSLDHSLCFYNNDFDCGDWLLYLMTSPVAGMGRAVASGLLYSADGTLLATVSQEGVARANIRRPSKETPQVKAKI